jgi:hypothetical protein
MKFDIYGRKIEVVKHDAQWRALYFGDEGKKRMADDITIPSHLGEDELLDYLADLCHEWSREGFERVIKL